MMRQSLAEYLLNKLADALQNDFSKRPIPKDPGQLFFYHELQKIFQEVRAAQKAK